MKHFFLTFLMAANLLPAADFYNGQAARFVVGQPNAFTYADPNWGQNTLGGVGGIAFANQMLIVADSNRVASANVNNRVVFFPADQFPDPLSDNIPQNTGCPMCVGSGILVLGQPDFATNTANLNQTGMRTASAVASDGKVVAVADTDNNRVLLWLKFPTANNQPADVVLGQVDFTHNGTATPPTATSLRGPQGVWIQNGKLFIADTADNRILIYNAIPNSNGASPDVVVGQPDFVTNQEASSGIAAQIPATAANMQSPTSVTAAGTHMFVTDLSQNRVLIYNQIPTSNGVSADVVVGQPDFVSSVPNNSYTATASSAGTVTSSPVLCQSNGTDTTVTPNVPTYPIRCEKTLSFPRFALSDGQRLFIADGGNDRVLVFNTIPSANASSADVVLGQVDFVSDTPSNATNLFRTPMSLAWDGTNLYVSNPYDRRIMAFSGGEPNLSASSIRNAASREIHATANLTLGGTIQSGDTVTVTVVSTAYTYTVTSSDTLATVVTNLAAAINKSPGDANVFATPNTATSVIVLTARQEGNTGLVAYTTATSSSAKITIAPASGKLTINLADAAEIAPGSLVSIAGVNLSEQTAVGDLSGEYVATSLGGVRVLMDGIFAPLLYVSPTQINAQVPFAFVNRSSSSVYVHTTHSDGSVTVSAAVPMSVVAANPGLFAEAGPEPRVGYVFHAYQNANGIINIGGTIKAGDIGTIKVGTNSYSYTVLAADTLATVTTSLAALVNTDPLVTAQATNEFDTIFLVAREPGTAGNSITYSVSTSSGATLTLSALNTSLCCANTSGGRVVPGNEAIPGEVVYTLATGLGVTSDASYSVTGKVSHPPYSSLATPVDSILTDGKSANILSAEFLDGTIGVYKVTFGLSSALTTNPAAQLTIAQQLFVSNIVTFPVKVP